MNHSRNDSTATGGEDRGKGYNRRRALPAASRQAEHAGARSRTAPLTLKGVRDGGEVAARSKAKQREGRGLWLAAPARETKLSLAWVSPGAGGVASIDLFTPGICNRFADPRHALYGQ